MEKIAIITGASKGIGKALTEMYAKNGYFIYVIARTSIPNSEHIKSFQADLAKTKDATDMLIRIFNNINIEKLQSITLINNAGSLGEIAPIEKNSIDSIQQTFQLNSITPIAFSGAFIHHFKNFKGVKNILNISSGAAVKPYYGWTVYCSSKAALDMATKTIASEQETEKNPAKINAIYPGVVATEMQETIRNTSEENFKNVQRFIDLKNENNLYSSEFVAEKIYELDRKNILKNGEIIDIRTI
jgi:benzil reductase ((S)-benzoin forming)